MAAATAGVGGRGGLGWVILAAALAIPGVLFYSWWSHLKAERVKTVVARARGRIPVGGVFQTSPRATKLINPMTPATVAPPAPVPFIAVIPPVASASAPVVAAPIPLSNRPSTPAVSTPAAPSLARDPMISPFDTLRLKEEEDEKRLARQRLLEERVGKRPRGSRGKPRPETLIELQGIISNAGGGAKAIVNNEVVGTGESVGKFRVVRITPADVTFEYQGRRFTKSVSRE